jgi:hypothetical protein
VPWPFQISFAFASTQKAVPERAARNGRVIIRNTHATASPARPLRQRVAGEKKMQFSVPAILLSRFFNNPRPGRHLAQNKVCASAL